MTDEILGIGSRVSHPAYGEGAIIRVHKAAYEVCFMKFGIKQVGKNYREWEIIDAIEAQAVVSFNEAEKALIESEQKDLANLLLLATKWWCWSTAVVKVH